MNFRKKPVIIEAVRFNGSTQWDEAPEWLIDATQLHPDLIGSVSVDRWAKNYDAPVCAFLRNPQGRIDQLEPGDWLIKSHEGLTACKPEIFELTYEPAE